MALKSLFPEIILSDHHGISRRRLGKAILQLGTATLLSNGLLRQAMAAEEPVPAKKPPFPVDKGDDNPLLNTQRVNWRVTNGELMHGYIAVPAAARNKLPTVLIIHDEQGLDFATREYTRQMALKGYIALAPDFLSAWGGMPEDLAKTKSMLAAVDWSWIVKDAAMTVDWLKNQRYSTGKVGVIGFGWGGKLAQYTAAKAQNALTAAIAYYSDTPPIAEAANIKAPLQLHFGTSDSGVNASALNWISALKAASVPLECYFYPNVGHGFMNESQPAYNEAAAKEAWQRSNEFLTRNLAPKESLVRKIDKGQQKLTKEQTAGTSAPISGKTGKAETKKK
ncbi:MAG: dienelactone hydrolase family protein [Zymomonas mobilis]|uniref:Carboxymethylenebutenolidase n=1 Tax=Zymomonas mobilis TaxID=542 RepID=A0A542W2A2_ZYMMB|nr:dienelactone hydrolase family protein [Zymomonas mobilis]TQL17693.1 carboxymethylenebutenolidase [Zymomonas mobilis]